LNQQFYRETVSKDTVEISAKYPFGPLLVLTCAVGLVMTLLSSQRSHGVNPHGSPSGEKTCGERNQEQKRQY
jgi:hypothetical protein